MRLRLSSLAHKLRLTAVRTRGFRAYDPHARQTRLRGPAAVQIQIIDVCNGACIMCPSSSLAKPIPAHLMEDVLYSRVLEEVRRIGTVSTVLLMLQNGRLLDRRFPSLVRQAKETLGSRVHVKTVTNGTPLTGTTIEAVAGCGVDHVTVSIDAVHEDTFRSIRPGLDFQRIVGNTLSLIRRLGPRRVGVKFLRQRQNEAEEGAFSNYWRRQGLVVIVSAPTNRAGWLES